MVRRAACWMAVGAGAAAVIGYVVCLVHPIAVCSPRRMLRLGPGALEVYWQPGPGFVAFPGALAGIEQPGWRVWLALQEPMLAPSNGVWPSPAMGRFVLPLWIPLLLGLWCGYWLLPERGQRDRCIKCGYDLMGVPAKGGKRICPECGAAESPSPR